MTKASDNVFSRLLISEGGSSATPAAGRVTVYAKPDGLVYSKDDAGVEKLMSTGSGSGTAYGAKAYHSTTQAIAASTSTAVAFDSEEFDAATNPLHDVATNNTRFTNASGATRKFELSGMVRASAALAPGLLWWRKNGTTALRSQMRQDERGFSVHTVAELANGDYVELMFWASGAVSIGSAAVTEEQTVATVISWNG